MSVERVMPVKSPIGLMSLSSFEACARERLEEPEVDTVESEEEDGWVGWPKRACCRF
jgi:protein-L-isoaspartate O-methyltransferase